MVVDTYMQFIPLLFFKGFLPEPMLALTPLVQRRVSATVAGKADSPKGPPKWTK
jgi:hypothetical protein